METKGGTHTPILSGLKKFVNGTIRILKSPSFDAAANVIQKGIGSGKWFVCIGLKTKRGQWKQRHIFTKRLQRLRERPPILRALRDQRCYSFWEGEDSESAVRICFNASFCRCRAEAIERRQSSLVIVEKSGLSAGGKERVAADAGRAAGEAVRHVADMLISLILNHGNANNFAPKILQSHTITRFPA
jgi:hypothetical protein